MSTNSKLQSAVRLALGIGAGALAVSAAPNALAQDEGADVIEEIVTTGSRIKKRDFTSNAPIATVGFEQIELTGTVNTESLLNTLPQTVPGLDRTSNNPGNGTATVDLRGLGSNRTLVLINGTRVVPTTSGGSVDINAIPNSLIDSIEVLTGGASAVYGSDAVAGVVNFILKDDFEGVAINAGYETSTKGDAEIYSADLTLGANLYDGRGNVTFNFAYTDRQELFQGDRDFAFFAQFDDVDADGNLILIDGGSSGIPGTSIFSTAFQGAFPDSFAVTFEPNGSIREFVGSGNDNDFYNYAPVNYIQLPQKRWQSTALGHFDINDHATVYGRAMFTSSNVPQELAPTPIFQTTTYSVDGSPFLTPEAQQILSDGHGDGIDTDGDGIDDTATSFVRRRLLEVGPRTDDGTFTSYQVQAGIRGDITDNWDYDAYIQTGNVNFGNQQSGNVNRDRFDQALLLDLVADPTGGTCQDGSTSGSTVGCSPINIFGEGNISEQGAAFLRTAVASTADYDMNVYGLNFSGDLGETIQLPGGAIGLAFGFERIEQDFDFRPSQDLASGDIAGFNGAPPVSGAFEVDSFYGELYLPILSGVTGFEVLDLELAYRNSDYTTSGKVEAYKAAGSWAPVESFRFRGGYNRAVRAPSIGELFSPQGENFPGAQDPCAAEGSPTAAQEPICVSTGVPAAVVGSPAINLPAGQVRAITGGNPELQPEIADTFTVGAVWEPNFIEGLSLSVDYFDIQIEDYITEFGGGASNVLKVCYDPSDEAGGIGSDFCNIIDRRGDGTIRGISLTQANVAQQTLKGYDVLGTYDFEMFGGDMRLNYVGTYTTESIFTAFDGATPIECAGKFGLNQCFEPLPEYGHRMTFNWTRDNFTTQLAWRYVGEVEDDDPDFEYTIENIGSQNYFDLSGVYRFTDNYSLTIGIDNLADKSPPIIGDNQEQANTWPATYDVFGRTVFLRATAEF